MSRRIVIIGGGLAGATAAQELRSLGHEGPIDLVCGEPYAPHERPPLSKGFMAGDEDLSTVFVGPEDWQGELDVTLHLDVRAESLDGGTVKLSDGSALPFDHVLIATGLIPRTPEVPGAHATNVHTFRTIDDAIAVRTALEAGGKRVVCIGSGWISLELAAAARGYDNEVTVVSRSATPLAAALGTEMGRVFEQLHTEHGVAILTERTVTAIELHDGASGAAADAHAVAVQTDRERIPADIVLIGIGADPDSALAERSGIEVADGILVNARMETSLPGVYAAGDVANAFHPGIGKHLRSEHWAFAIASGKVAASTMTGGSATLTDIPYFFTDQYDLGMEYSGFGGLAEHAEVVIRGDVPSQEFIAFWLAEGRVIAGMNVNVWDVQEHIQRLIREQVAVTAAQLRDESLGLQELA